MTHVRSTVSFAPVEPLEARDVPAASFTDLPLTPDYDPETLANVRRIAYVGQTQGRRSDVFLKVGDSNSHSPEFMRALGQPVYNPVLSGMPADLLATWATYRAPADAAGHNSFSRDSLSDLGAQFTSWMVGQIDDELAATNAGVALIQAGTTEIPFPGGFERTRANLAAMIDFFTAAGVVPVLNTLPWMRRYGNVLDPVTIQFNQMIADLADEKDVPVINLWRAMEPLPNNGLKFTNELGRDFLHLNVSPRDPGGFTAFDLAFAQNLRALLTLQALRSLQTVAFDPIRSVDSLALQPWTPIASGQAVFAAGPSIGEAPVVTVFDAKTGDPLSRVLAYEPSFQGGVNVAVGDVSGDGVADVVTGPGFGGGPLVRAFSGTDGGELFSFFAYEESFRGGVTVAVGDTDGDGANEIVVGSGAGGGPRVRSFRTNDRGIIADFFAFDPSFRGGVNVAVGNFDGTPGIAVGTGNTGAPIVQRFTATGEPQGGFAAYDLGLRGGVNIAAGDVDGDGLDEIVTAPGPGGSPHVRVFDPVSGGEKASFFADAENRNAGFNVGVIREPGSPDRIITGSRVISGTPVRVWSGIGQFLGAPAIGGVDLGLLSGAFVG